MLWSISGSGTSFTITVPGLTEKLILTGIPQIRSTDTGEVPVSAVISGNAVDFEMPSPVLDGSAFVLQPLDPAVRTESGRYLAAGQVGTYSPFEYAVGTGPVAAGTVVCDAGTPFFLTIQTLPYPDDTIVLLNKSTSVYPVTVNDPSGVQLAILAPGEAYVFTLSGSTWTATQLI
jgi:hypothetical protein